mmetsp:Transcript_13767/g.20155  ORF Transcript_13767/g.20155 Transcript_13767/m.20155 type:complete len:99 (+) Transcript_13767:37-333(+)
MNNALRNTARTALNAQRRYKSTNTYLDALNAESFNNVRKELLSDPSTYPLIVILGCAVAGCTGFGCWHLTHASDVRMGATRRNQLIRDWEWGREKKED